MPTDKSGDQPGDSEITLLLEKWRGGNRHALAELMPLIYSHLRSMAAGIMKSERSGHTLSPTAVVHEIYLRLYGVNVAWQDRRHFLAIAAREMRRVLVDHARSRQREKRGGDMQRITLTNLDAQSSLEIDLVDLLSMDQALDKLHLIDARKSEVVNLILFGGLTVEETAATLQISTATVNRDWKFARAFLHQELKYPDQV
jgi:RNA polymerase sigma-70 factor (ECF subfamily)